MNKMPNMDERIIILNRDTLIPLNFQHINYLKNITIKNMDISVCFLCRKSRICHACFQRFEINEYYEYREEQNRK